MRNEQNKINLPVMRILLIIQLCAISLCTGCSSVNSNTESVSTVTEDTEDCISLDKIQPPEFMKKFAILYCNNMATDLYWGYAENEITDGYFWTTSSYPGFKYTVIIQFNYFKETNTVSLKTKYGQYVYTLDSVYSAFIENNELVNKDTGDKVNLLDPKTERLAIYNSVAEKVFQYTLKKGTTINIE